MSRAVGGGRPCPTEGCTETVFPWTRFCWGCHRYLTDVGADKTGGVSVAGSVADSIPDTRPEAEIRRAIRDLLRLRGYSVWDTEQQRKGESTRVTAGLPDLLVMGNGRLLFVECKSAKGKLTEAQRSFAHHCATTGTEHRVWRSETDAIEWMSETEGAE